MRDVVVSAAVIERDDAFLLTRRAVDTHLGGRWEFPGGKAEAGETLDATLVREIREELGCGVEVGPLLLTTRHAYPDVHVELHFFSRRALSVSHSRNWARKCDGSLATHSRRCTSLKRTRTWWRC